MVIKIDEIWKEAKKNILKCAATEKTRYDRKDSGIEYRVGDWVRLFEPAVKVGLKQKLRNERWAGPFQILRLSENHNVTIRLGNGKDFRFHTDRIKHAKKQRNAGSYVIESEPAQSEQQTRSYHLRDNNDAPTKRTNKSIGQSFSKFEASRKRTK